MNLLATKILSCSGYDVKVGDILLPMQVSEGLKLSVDEAKLLLEELEQQGYLIYDVGNARRVSGWHFTQKGIDALK